MKYGFIGDIHANAYALEGCISSIIKVPGKISNKA